MCGCSTALEPIFATAYIMRYYDENEEWTERTVIHPLFEEYHHSGKPVDHFQGAYEVTPRGHLEMQAIVQKHVDNSVSKTINVPADFPKAELSELLMEYLPRIKGVTIYPSGGREGEPLTPVPVEEVINQGCRSGVCEL